MLALILASTLAVPDRPLETPDNSWVGKIVYARSSPLYLDLSAEPNEAQPQKMGTPLNMLSYRVYAERANHVLVKDREGINGWLRKADCVTLDESVAFFTKQIEANPNDSNGFNRRAAAWKAKGELDAALKDANEALRLTPSQVLFNNRALIWLAKGDHDKALADFNTAINMNPQYGLALVNRANLWQIKKEYDKAIADCTNAVQFQPRFPNGFRQRGIAWHGKKDYDKAIVDFNKALELDAKFALASADRAVSLAAKKEHAKALVDFNDALRMEPSNVLITAAAALWLASCPEAKFRDGKRALELARQAQKLERTSTPALQALAAAHAEVGQFADAVRWQEHVLQDPQLAGDGVARARLELYKKMQPYRHTD